MPFSIPPPARQDFTDRGGEWVDATIVWLRQLQDYVNRISNRNAVVGLELAQSPATGILSGQYGDVELENETRHVYNPGPNMPSGVMCWVQNETIVGWFCS